MALNLKRSARWFALALASLAILGAVLWMYSPRILLMARSAAPEAAPVRPAQLSEAAGALGNDASDMLKMTRAAFVSCGAPAPPTDVPDGATATREQMEVAHATVKAFDEATTIYTRCLDTTAYQAGVQFRSVATSADIEALGILQIQLHNAAIDRDQVLANRFNAQLRRYKARPQ